MLTLLARELALPWYGRSYRRFEQALQRAHETTPARLLDRVRQCRETRFGRDHQFAGIRTLADFKRHVPVARYDDFAPYINAVAAGDHAALFPDSERLLRMTITTGTTGVPKLNPVTTTWLREYCAAWDVWSTKLVLDHPDIVGRKVLQIVGTWDMGQTPGGIPISMVSALAAREAPFIARQFYALPEVVSGIRDPESKYYTILRLTITQPIGLLVTISPGSLLRLAELGNRERERLIRDIHDGTLSTAFEIPAAIRQQLQRSVRQPAPQQARRLERLVETTGTLSPRDYWPDPVIGCWLGGTAGFQSRYLTDHYGAPKLRDMGLVSSEGRHTIPIADNTCAGLLAANSNYYEFIPLADCDHPQPSTLEAHELQEGADYSLVMTTAAGYYRYQIDDIVRCRGFVGRVPLIEFLQKASRYCDLEGEKLTESQFITAASESAADLGIELGYISAAPWRVGREAPCYVALVEHSNLPDPELARRFVEDVDRRMAATNFVYAARRREHVLAPLRLWRLAPGAWTTYVAAEIARRGTGEVQYKHPGLLTDSTVLDRFLPIDVITPRHRAAA